LANGEIDWTAALTSGAISASGTRADLSQYLPLQGNISGVNRIAP